MTERVLGPTGSRRRKRRLLAMSALIGSLLTIFFVAASGATLTNSTFDTANGDLTDLTENDWNPVNQPAGNDGPIEPIDCVAPGLSNCGLDLVNDANDNAYGQGAKEDDVSPSVVTGSIPPQKDDLSRFYVNKQRVGSGSSATDFLYLAWERSNLLGSAHMDFEFNQKFCDLSATPTNCAANNVNPVRTKGDLLIDFDFGGSGPVGLFLHKWITSDGGNAADCEASNSLPCWDEAVTLTNAEASVNSADVTDNNPPSNPRILDGESKQTGQGTTVSSEFGEAGINLTASGLFPVNQCVHFGSASLKSRSAGSSFSSELKDFIAPIPVNISNCGRIELVKDFVGAPSSARANLYIKDSTETTTIDSELNAADGGTTGKNNVIAGSYVISETAGTDGTTATDFANYSTTVACVEESTNPDTPVTVSSQTLTGATRKGTVSVAVNADIKCTFTNTLLTGAIKVTKTGKDKRCLGAGDPDANCVSAGVRRLSGVTFQLKKGSTVIGNMAETSTAGVYCTQGLLFGTDYTIQETAAPTGYKIDDPNVSSAITVSASGTCASGAVNAGTYTDTPLSTIQVQFTSLAGAGVTASQIVCKKAGVVVPAVSENNSADDEVTPVYDDTNETFGNGTSTLVPGIYTCTIDVDP